MTVRSAAGGVIELVDLCPNEDAEPLLQLLLATPGAAVDWRGCRGAQTAVIQVLMAVRPRLLGPPAEPRLEKWVEPVLRRPPASERASHHLGEGE